MAMKKHKAQTLTMQQKQANELVLNRMSTVLNYTKNPRHKSIVPDFRNDHTTPAQTKGPLRVEPGSVFFTNYDLGKVYEQTLSIINASKLTTRLKIIPPQVLQFSIGTPIYPAENVGEVAPGMRVLVPIHFKPSSLNPFKDKLLICTQEDTISIQLLAKRQDPILKFSAILVFPDTWVGFSSQASLLLQNQGGDGEFFLQMQPSLYFQLNLKSFCLSKGTKYILKGKFSPKDQKQFSEQIRIRADTGQVWPLKLVGKGNMMQLQLLSIDGKQHTKGDPIRTIFIENAYPQSKITKTINLKNMAHVRFSYQWQLADVIGNFGVVPSGGMFQPNQNKAFQFYLNTKGLQPCQCKANLLIKGLPIQCIKKTGLQLKKDLIVYQSFVIKSIPAQCHVSIYPPQLFVPNVLLYHLSSPTLVLLNQSVVGQKFKIHPLINEGFQFQEEGVLPAQGQSKLTFSVVPSKPQPIKFQGIVKLQYSAPLNVKVIVIPQTPSIHLSQSVIDFGLVQLRKKTTKYLQIVSQNDYVNQVWVDIVKGKFYQQSSNHDFYQIQLQKKPRVVYSSNVFDLPSYGKVRVPLELAAEQLQLLDITGIVHVRLGQQKYFRLVGSVQQVQVGLSQYSIEFEQAFVDVPCKPKTFQIYNLGRIPTTFQWENWSSSSEGIVRVTPQKGELGPYQSISCQIDLKPMKKCKIKKLIRCKLKDAEPLGIIVEASAKGIQLKFQLVDQSKRIKKQVLNKALSKSVARTKRSKVQSSTFSDEEQQVVVYDYPLLEKVQFFGCKINQPKQIQLIVKNLSGIDALVSLKAQRLGIVLQSSQADTITDKSLERSNQQSFNSSKKSKSKTRSIIKAIPRLFRKQPTVFTSQTGKLLDRRRKLQKQQNICLQGGKGLAVVCRPNNFKLRRHSEQRITITLFNVTCGSFTDNLLVEVQDIQPIRFPINIFIEGSPLSVSRSQLNIDFTQAIPVCYLGCFTNGSQYFSRDFKISNDGPDEIVVDWKMYNRKMVSPGQNLFNIDIQAAKPGSTDIVYLKWNAIQPPQQTGSCFTLTPKSNNIKPKSELTFNLKFRADQCQFFSSVLVAKPRYADPSRDSAMLFPISLIIQAKTQPPSLYIDKKYQIGKGHAFKFQMLSLGTSIFTEKDIVLRNTQQSNLTFKINVSGPFRLIKTATNSSQKNLFATRDSLIQTNFVLVPNSLLQARIKYLGAQPGNYKEWPIGEQIHQHGQLKIVFSNGSEQLVRLQGYLFRPSIRVLREGSKDGDQLRELDFGLVSTKNIKSISLVLSNPSRVDCKWKLTHQAKSFNSKGIMILSKLQKEEMQKIDDPTCFNFSLTEGLIPCTSLLVHPIPETLALPAPQLSPALVPQKIKITFKPKLKGLYKSRFRISVETGGYVELSLRGMGSYDEQVQQ